VEKSLDEFYNSKLSDDKKGYRCKQCDTIARKRWAKNNPEKAHLSQRGRNLKHKYGITLEDYEDLLEKQDHRCACCGVEENTAAYGFNKSLNFSVDHCHEGGGVRGLLCNQCNRAIGMLGDTSEKVYRAYKYLKDHETK